MKAMILSAGLGTRLKPITNVYAKPAVPFLNVPLLFYSLAMVRQAGISSVVFNTHHKPEQIEALGKSLESEFQVAFSPEPLAPLGSGGGIYKARKLLQGADDILVCNGDEVILPLKDGAMTRFLQAHRESAALATLLVMEHPHVGTQFGGVWATDDHRVLGFGKERSQFPSAAYGYHYTGLLLLNERAFSYFPEGESNILYDVLQSAIAKGEKIRIHVEDLTWFETGNPNDYLRATEQCLKLLGPDAPSRDDAKFLREILRTHGSRDSAIAFGENRIVMTGRNCRIDERASFSGFVVIGDDAAIEHDVILTNCVVLPKTVVSAGMRVENEILF